MKNKILFYLGILLLPFAYSCDEEGIDEVKTPDAFTPMVKDVASLNFSPAETTPEGAFVYNKELVAGGTNYWNITSVDFDVNLDLGELSANDVSKIDLYLFVEEQNEDNFKYLGSNQGKLLTTINNPSKLFQVSVSKEDIESLYGNDFSANHNGEILPSDIFEFKWVVTGKDGSVKDTRTDCAGFDCTFGFGTTILEVAPPIWEGTFNYEWIEMTANAIRYGGISVGQTGTISMTLQPGSYTVYDVSDASCDYYYGGPGVLSYSYDTGKIEILSSKNDQVWTVLDVDGQTITIAWSYKYSAGYDEYATFTLTRTDGQDWPDNINTN